MQLHRDYALGNQLVYNVYQVKRTGVATPSSQQSISFMKDNIFSAEAQSCLQSQKENKIQVKVQKSGAGSFEESLTITFFSCYMPWKYKKPLKV